ncbi:MAG: ABC transporter ATP-binding protein [Betaproteobacteria bacterium]|nr:ABC transporter ATP-binding protein [Betaproteobacteria bacterium]MCC6249165.1 ABC transporter ATP-binding protein [Rubrivivax sp.]
MNEPAAQPVSKATSTAGIEFRQVTKRYGGPAAPLVVKGIDLVVPKGTLTTILGPSGCGKTTLLRMIAGLDAPTGGRILIDGADVTTLGPAERNVSMVFQSYALFPHMSVLDNVGYGLVVSGVGKDEAARRARHAMENVGLTGYDQRSPSELSGGQQQRVAVARSLVLEPSVMLFDEPLSNLDARLRRSMREEIRALQQRLNLTVAYVTHDQSEALAVSDQIVVMDAGLIAQVGTPREMYEQPASEFVAGFMGEAMVFAGTALEDGNVRLGPITVRSNRPVPPGPVKVAVRPEAWQAGAPSAGGPRALEARLVKQSYLGSFVELTLATELGEVFVVSPDVQRRWQPGDMLSLRLGERSVSVVAAG